MRWHIKSTIPKNSDRLQSILTLLYQERGLNTQKDIDAFLHPPDPLTLSPESVGLNRVKLKKAISIIKNTKKFANPILIYGDYDADGITATAILWEALHQSGYIVFPFIPKRDEHGYGLSIPGVQDALKLMRRKTGETKKPLIITVDNGISSIDTAQYLHQNGYQLIITDHHQMGDQLPNAAAVVHSDRIAGSAVSWMLVKEFNPDLAKKSLDLVAIGTVADIMPLVGPNRSIVKHGLQALRQTSRFGLQAIFRQSSIDLSQELSTYHIGYNLAPRLNAMGRLADATDSLRLLLTRNKSAAIKLAQLLTQTNQHRQEMTKQALDIATKMIDKDQHLLIVAHKNFHEGIVGLIAGKLTEEFHRPAIAISIGNNIAKGSARSLNGISIIELIRQHQDLLINAGGHTLAAGLSLKPEMITQFTQQITATAKQAIKHHQLEPVINIDCQLQTRDITWELYHAIEKLHPFGPGNSRPIFALKNIGLVNVKYVGKNNSHLKATIANAGIEIIGFNLAQIHQSLDSSQVDIAFTLMSNTWNGQASLQLSLKAIQPS